MRARFVNEHWMYPQPTFIDKYPEILEEINNLAKQFGLERGDYIRLEDSIKKLPEKEAKFWEAIQKAPVSKYIMRLSAYLGYLTNNELTMTFPGERIERKFAYHLTNKSNLDFIKKNGLVPTKSQSDRAEFKGSGEGTMHVLPYKAIFLLSRKGETKKLANFFNFDDPILLKVDTAGLEMWRDPNFPKDMDSMVTFESIPPEKISEA